MVGVGGRGIVGRGSVRDGVGHDDDGTGVANFAFKRPYIRRMTDLPVSFSSQGIPRDRARTRATGRAARRSTTRSRSRRPRGATPCRAVVARWPRFLDGWARLGELARDDVEAYACFRVGYHRGLDRLRQSGWRGSGYVRWEHETNRGFLRALDGLRRAAAAIGEADEEQRCDEFLHQLDRAGIGSIVTNPSTFPVMKRALITGITGQDGRFLAQFLIGKGYQVFGLIRGQNNPKGQMVVDETPALELVDGDLRDLSSLIAAVEQVQPDEVYNLGAISFVKLSWSQPELTAEITGLGVLRMLEAVRIVGGSENNPIRFYQASSSEMFGKVRETPQNELTPFHPRSPYGVAKVFGHHITVNYRESYGMHASSGILLQPRERAARPRVRLPQDHQRARAHQARAPGLRSPSATSTRRATGATPATTSRRCG